MTLADVQLAMPGAIFARGYDGDGVASASVVIGGASLLTLVAGGDEGDAIDWTRTIRSIETFDVRCRTTDGVHPGALVVNVEKILGRTPKIIRSEIESREFIEFEQQPVGRSDCLLGRRVRSNSCNEICNGKLPTTIPAAARPRRRPQSSAGGRARG